MSMNKMDKRLVRRDSDSSVVDDDAPPVDVVELSLFVKIESKRLSKRSPKSTEIAGFVVVNSSS